MGCSRLLLLLLLLLVLALAGCVSEPTPVDPEAGMPCSEPTFCDGKCGAGLADKCGLSRNCASCGEGNTCDGNTHKCLCTELPNLCANRCGMIPTNCNMMKNCGGCDGGACPAVGNCTGCMPDDVTACAGRECGSAMNNCMQQIVCGPMTGACPGAKQCSTSGKCCDTQSVVCAGKCGMLSAACGSPFDCGQCALKTNACTNNTCQCNCPMIVPKAPNCMSKNGKNGCSCAMSNGNTDPSNCGCQGVVCPNGWSCDLGMCIPP